MQVKAHDLSKQEDNWITGREAMEILEFTNYDSVRQLKNRGAIRWRRQGNGRVEYSRADVQEWRRRRESKSEAA